MNSPALAVSDWLNKHDPGNQQRVGHDGLEINQDSSLREPGLASPVLSTLTESAQLTL